mmetsp:Transcript_42319/g.103715  ORF Transcript_42319/g.103715 Transcript_42319/m.103715 type:complete len:153 (-) Transcript_42319:263-721(-)
MPDWHRFTATLILLSATAAGVAAAPASCLINVSGGGTISYPAPDGTLFCVRYCFKCAPGDGGCTDAEIEAKTVRAVYVPVAEQQVVDYLNVVATKVFSCDTSDCNAAVQDGYCTSSTPAPSSAGTLGASLLVALASSLVACVRAVGGQFHAT